MNLKTVYQSEFNDDSYSILKVPIFGIIQKQAGDVADKVEFNQDDLKNMVKKFQEGASKDYYPRVFIGHHNPASPDNRTGIGFLDNLFFQDNIIFADIVKINPDTFNEIKSLKYPYRSVEIKNSTKEIRGLALLESQPPYFGFPLLNVSNFSEEDVMNYGVSSKLYFADTEFKKKTDDKMSDKPEKEDTPPREEDGPNKDAPPPIKQPNNQSNNQPNNRLNPDGSPVQTIVPVKVDNTGALENKIDKLTKLVEQLLMMEVKEELDKNPYIEGNKMSLGIKPGTITMQDELVDLRNKVIDLTVENKLNSMFSDATVREAHKKVLSLIPAKEKDKYLAMIEEKNSIFQGHPATDALENFKGDPTVLDKNILNKYASEPVAIRNVAREALSSWQETISHPNEKYRTSFQSSGFLKAEDFVDHVVAMEKIQPNYLKTLTV